MMKEENSINFVVRHYRKGAFNMQRALKNLHKERQSWWTPLKIAAACVAFAILSVTAGVIYHNSFFAQDDGIGIDEVETFGDIHEIRVIDFEQAPLPQVVERINEVYGVTVTNLPDDASSYILSLHYEGSAFDLIEVVNDLLGTNITLEQ